MYLQKDRPIKLNTPLGSDALLLVSLQGREAISELFHFDLQTAWNDQTELLKFEQLLGRKVTVEISPSTNKRYISGIVSRITQGHRDNNFTYYSLEVVPQLWLLDRKANSRTFQHVTVPEILKSLLAGFEVSYQIEGTFEQREYCVQYRETDFAFASRLMEEEGIYYFFKHTIGGHQLVLANTPQAHPAIPYLPTVVWDDESNVAFEEDRVFGWQKGQEIRSGKYVNWDECFEMPGKHLEAEKEIIDTVTVGTVTHKLKVAGNENLEIYDYPGGYASRYDGVAAAMAATRASSLQNIFTDNKRTVEIRMQEEPCGACSSGPTARTRHLRRGTHSN